MRVNRVARCLKSPGTCGRCGKVIAKGEPYVWAKGRYTSKRVRCAEFKCRLRDSDLTDSKMSAAWAATEAVEDTLDAWEGDDAEEVATALTDCAEAIREVAQEYRDSFESLPENLQQGGVAQGWEEKADELESFADSLDDAAQQLPDPPDDEEFSDKDGKETDAATDWRDEVREAALSATGEIPS